jgi:SAM-dependent methyltransferase
MDQTGIDARIQTYYTDLFDEATRLTTRSASGRLEFQRVQEIIGERLEPSSRIVDIGGAAGVHSAALAAAGHIVTLVDPVPSQVEQARQHGTFTAQVGDARELEFADDSFDAALLFGPLYHLADRDDRLRSLREARRVVRTGGWVFAAAIPRFVALAMLTLAEEIPHPYPKSFVDMLEHGTADSTLRFPAGHYHTAEELEQEVAAAGLVDVSVLGLEGPAGLALEVVADADSEVYLAALTIARRVSSVPGIRDMSNHMLATARVP